MFFFALVVSLLDGISTTRASSEAVACIESHHDLSLVSVQMGYNTFSERMLAFSEVPRLMEGLTSAVKEAYGDEAKVRRYVIKVDGGAKIGKFRRVNVFICRFTADWVGAEELFHHTLQLPRFCIGDSQTDCDKWRINFNWCRNYFENLGKCQIAFTISENVTKSQLKLLHILRIVWHNVPRVEIVAPIAHYLVLVKVDVCPIALDDNVTSVLCPAKDFTERTFRYIKKQILPKPILQSVDVKLILLGVILTISLLVVIVTYQRAKKKYKELAERRARRRLERKLRKENRRKQKNENRESEPKTVKDSLCDQIRDSRKKSGESIFCSSNSKSSAERGKVKNSAENVDRAASTEDLDPNASANAVDQAPQGANLSRKSSARSMTTLAKEDSSFKR